MNERQWKLRLLREEILSITSDPEGIIRPNFSMMAREIGVSRQTVAKTYKQILSGELQPRKKRTKKSKFDPYNDEIKALFESPEANIKSVFEKLQGKYGDEIFRSYDAFKSHVRARKFRSQ